MKADIYGRERSKSVKSEACMNNEYFHEKYFVTVVFLFRSVLRTKKGLVFRSLLIDDVSGRSCKSMYV